MELGPRRFVKGEACLLGLLPRGHGGCSEADPQHPARVLSRLQGGLLLPSLGLQSSSPGTKRTHEGRCEGPPPQPRQEGLT